MTAKQEFFAYARLAAARIADRSPDMRGELRKCKEEFLLDMIRRVCANLEDAAEVAKAIAKDWNPTIYVQPDGSYEFRL
jgi:hypothetical protein